MLQSAVEFYRRQQRFTAAALLAADRSPSPVELARIIAAIQLLAARDSLDAIEPMLDEQGISAPIAGVIAASSFAGTASDGRPLESLFAVAENAGSLALMAVTQVQDAARQAASVSIAARPNIGYVRMLNPPSCARCAILAGKFFRYNQGFLRHPRCDCRHIPSTEDRSDDLRTDPDAYFASLSPAEQDRIFTKGGAEVIRQGADVSQVVNARRVTAGMQFAQGSRTTTRIINGEEFTVNVKLATAVKRDARGNLYTTEGTTRRGIAGQQQAGLRVNGPQQIRLMPETILARAKDRDDAQRLLKLYGYIADPDAAARGRAVFADARRNERNARARARRAGQ